VCLAQRSHGVIADKIGPVNSVSSPLSLHRPTAA
jgi:hypothetical protein